jgi:uncharacterized protein YegL
MIPMKTRTKPSKGKTGDKPMLVAFLLDRSSSMGVCRDETISGFNSYINELRKKENGSARFTLTQFDTQGIDIIHDVVPLKAVVELTKETYVPRASTPLYDAIGRTVAATEKKAGSKYKVLFVTLTDGEENSSAEWNLEKIQDLIRSKENKDHWTFAHIGVGMTGWAQVRKMAHGTISCANVLHADSGDQVRTFSNLAGQTMGYASNARAGGQSISGFWNPEPPKPTLKKK